MLALRPKILVLRFKFPSKCSSQSRAWQWGGLSGDIPFPASVFAEPRDFRLLGVKPQRLDSLQLMLKVWGIEVNTQQVFTECNCGTAVWGRLCPTPTPVHSFFIHQIFIKHHCPGGVVQGEENPLPQNSEPSLGGVRQASGITEGWPVLRKYKGFPSGSSGKEPTCQCRRLKRCGFDAWVGKMPSWRRAWQPTPIFLPGKSHGQRSLMDYSPWGRKESDTLCH